jgi:tetratricopeptide (TPR) repeat protein
MRQMNDNDTIVAELRKIAAWADMQRKITKWSFIFIAVFIPAMVVFAIVMENHFKARLEDLEAPPKPEKPTWNTVDYNLRRANVDEAIRVGEELIQQMPQYPEGHQRLASAYLAAGKLEQAREHYAQLVRLFPSEENQKLLNAIDRRMKDTNQSLGL